MAELSNFDENATPSVINYPPIFLLEDLCYSTLII